MLNSIFQREDVIKTISEIITIDEFNPKNIPNRINEEAIVKEEYSIYMFLDALYKYAIIIEDEDLFPKYLERLKMIFRKLNTHNEIKNGITKLIIKVCGYKFGIEDYDSIENKKTIIRFIYEKYIVNGYLFHSFPHTFKDSVLTNGLNSNGYYRSLDEVKKINEILEKYNINNTFSKNLEDKESLYITDSFFMTCFYANNSPLYMQELCENIYIGKSKKFKKDSYVKKNYTECIDNINMVLTNKEATMEEKELIINFFDKEWKELKLRESLPTIALIKRSVLAKDEIENFQDLLRNIEEESLFIIISKILNVRYNEEEYVGVIDSKDINVSEIPRISDFYKNNKIEIIDEDKKPDIPKDFNEYGSATILALLGALLIALGVVLMFIMMGK